MKHTDEFILPIPVAQTRAVCERALRENEWQIEEAQERLIIGQMPKLSLLAKSVVGFFEKAFSFSLVLHPAPQGTQVILKCSGGPSLSLDVFGIMSGPAVKLREAIEALAKHKALPVVPEPLSPPDEPPEKKDTEKKVKEEAVESDAAPPAQSPSVTLFISYAREDKAFARRLQTDLEQRGMEAWIDEADIHSGEDWSERISKAIADCHIVLLVISPDSLTSKWVRRELNFADQKGKMVLPVMHRECEIPAWFDFSFGRVQRADFSQGNYEENFQDLLDSIGQLKQQC